jgi:hypothetical protein
MLRRAFRGLLCALALVVVTSVAAPELAAAQYSRPVILGTWHAEDSPVGNPPVTVTSRGRPWKGRATRTDQCVKKSRPIWRIDYASGNFASGSLEYFYVGTCSSAGFGSATWEFFTNTTGRLCSFNPLGGPQTCANIVRAGSPPPLPALYAIDPLVQSCLARSAWYQVRTAGCSQTYHAPGPGTWTTGVIYCHNPVGIPCPRDLRFCVPPSLSGVCYFPNARASTSGRKRKRPVLVTLTKDSFKFSQSGEGESSLLLRPTKKGRKRLKQLAKHRKKVKAYVLSSFEPTSGKQVGRSKTLTIHLH